jgi:glycerophosphoryl diester phosphodiesterase
MKMIAQSILGAAAALAIASGGAVVAARLGQAGFARPELVGYAVLPAETFAPGPASGAFRDNGERGEPRFASQPVQGFSAIRPAGDGAFLVLSDNGFGARKNSPDYRLRLYRIRPDFRRAGGGSGRIDVDSFIEIRDPDRKANFLIVNENTSDRLLTGADVDPESLAVARDGTFWIGDEFGPFLLHVDATGRLMAPPVPVPDPRAGTAPAKGVVRSPDNPFLAPPNPGQPQTATLGRSKGFESMTAGVDGAHLYALLEGTLAGDPAGHLRLLEFDLEAQRFTNRSWTYALSAPGHAVRDMAAINDHELLVIECDEGHGAAARFKKIVLIDLARPGADGAVSKEVVVDLMNVGDPAGLAGFGPTFTFPYQTIEAVAILDATTIVVANDNNFPGAGARRPGERDATELLLLKLERRLAIAGR